jgi:ADP-heptose:LPS heptosyltransferase
MKNETTKLKLILYATGHFIWRWLKNPFVIGSHLSNAYKLAKEGGFKKLTVTVFRQYLPKKYLLKTKINLKTPSSSIHGKLKTSIDPEINPIATNNSHEISTKIKILLVRSGALGDVLLTTPIVEKLFKKYDGLCSITVATRYPDIFINNPYVRKIISIRDLKNLEEAYDFILDLDSCYEKNRNLHITEAYNFYTFGINATKDNLQPKLFSSDQDKVIVERFIKSVGTPFIVCHNRVDLTQSYRNVPRKQWEHLIKSFKARTDLQIVQIGDKHMDIALDAKNEGFIDARNSFSLQQVKELISNAQLFLGTDAGPLHIAATTQTPIVSFFTIAHHNLRMPLRDNRCIFKPITPKIDCYGCQSNFSLAEPWVCQRKDFHCTSTFDIDEALETCLSICKQ